MRIQLQVYRPPAKEGLEASAYCAVDAIVRCKFPLIDKAIRFIVDTGASNTTLLDHDAKRLKIDFKDLKQRDESEWACGVGGKAPTYSMEGVTLLFLSSDHKQVVLERELTEINVICHNRDLYPEIREVPSLLGMDFLTPYKLVVAADKSEAYIEAEEELQATDEEEVSLSA